MAGKDDWVEDVRRWCFEGSRPAGSAVDGGTGSLDTHADGATDDIDAVAAARPWQPSRAEAIDPRDRNLLASQSGEAA